MVLMRKVQIRIGKNQRQSPRVDMASFNFSGKLWVPSIHEPLLFLWLVTLAELFVRLFNNVSYWHKAQEKESEMRERERDWNIQTCVFIPTFHRVTLPGATRLFHVWPMRKVKVTPSRKEKRNHEDWKEGWKQLTQHFPLVEESSNLICVRVWKNK